MSDKSNLLNQLKIDRNQAPGKKGLSLPLLITFIIISAFAGGIAALYFFAPSDAEIADRAEAIVREKTALQTILEAKSEHTQNTPANTEILNASGYVTARRMATVSAEVMGLITDVFVEEGMTVTEGQILAQLDSAIATSNLNYAEAQVKASVSRIGSIKANLAEAERVLKRVSALKTADFSSEASVTKANADVDMLKANLKSAEADVAVARIEVQRQQERLDDHTIKAPFAGVVTVKNAQPGEIVAPTSAGGGFTRTGICTIVDMDSLEIEVDVNEAFIGRVFAGQRVQASLDAYPEWKIPASVIAVIPTADRAKATVKVRIAIEAKDTRILPDMGIKVAFYKE
ncbi:efflux RND transporter periplasmic adaptor subunit [Kordiimonas pumila]|uniref:Efflux RND transporter periplasmic adaptor subunit n=1 Tax=Kordiimonas pumila TaxID=2161677 RepID=A0ABV7D938_9PROT|nr:efflux RND transporter periplasmic adaptor subunit [Kordiimonas pumila]